MDKFGVLKLLSSLFDLYKSNSSGSSPKTPSDFDVDKLLSPLKNLVGNNKDTENKNPTPSEHLSTPKNFAPLQSKMIAVMNSHDQIVERVKNNLSKQKTQR